MYAISNPLSPGNRNLEWDDNALRVPLRKPPCRTYKKEQAGIKLQDYCFWKQISNLNSIYIGSTSRYSNHLAECDKKLNLL